MIKYKNNQSGITLVVLIITIIFMLMLAVVGIYYGMDAYNKSKIMKFVAEMQAIQKKVDILAESGDYANIGIPAKSQQSNTETIESTLQKAIDNGDLQEDVVPDSSDFRYLSVEDIERFLDIENASGPIIVNFETRQVISVNGIKYKYNNKNQHFTQYYLPGGQMLIIGKETPDRGIAEMNISPDIKGISADLTVGNISITNGTLMYKLSDSEVWTTITNYTNAGSTYEVNISISGTYTFRLVDNTNSSNSRDVEYTIILTNEPQPEEGMTLTQTREGYNYTNYKTSTSSWQYATKVAGEYVWIPRYVYKYVDNVEQIKFVRGNSRIATDNTYIDDSWITPAKFGKNDTGIWCRVYAVFEQEKLDFINNNPR